MKESHRKEITNQLFSISLFFGNLTALFLLIPNMPGTPLRSSQGHLPPVTKVCEGSRDRRLVSEEDRGVPGKAFSW